MSILTSISRILGLASILNFLIVIFMIIFSSTNHKLIGVIANPNLRSTKGSESIQRDIARHFSITIRIDYDVIAHDKVIFSFALVKSRAAIMISKAQLARGKKFNARRQHTTGASPLSSGVPKKTPPAVLTGRRGRQDNGKRGI